MSETLETRTKLLEEKIKLAEQTIRPADRAKRLTRSDFEEHMVDNPGTEYLIRKSTTQMGFYAITYRGKDGFIAHELIRPTKDGFQIYNTHDGKELEPRETYTTLTGLVTARGFLPKSSATTAHTRPPRKPSTGTTLDSSSVRQAPQVLPGHGGFTPALINELKKRSAVPPANGKKDTPPPQLR